MSSQKNDLAETLEFLERTKINLITLLLDTQNEILALKEKLDTMEHCHEGCTCFNCEGK